MKIPAQLQDHEISDQVQGAIFHIELGYKAMLLLAVVVTNLSLNSLDLLIEKIR